MPSLARLIVERASTKDVRQRQIVLSLDGDAFATLLYGQSATREIAEGHHRLRAHNTLVWKTAEFDVRAGETIRFAAVNRAGPGTMTLVALLGVGPLYVTLERMDDTA